MEVRRQDEVLSSRGRGLHVAGTFAVLRRLSVSVVAAVAIALPVLPAQADSESAQGLIVRMSTEVLRQLKATPDIRDGEVAKVVALLNSEVLPSVDLERMTASATDHYWREASAVQRVRLEQEFGNWSFVRMRGR